MLTKKQIENFQAKFDHIEQLLIDDGTSESQDGIKIQSLAQVLKPCDQCHTQALRQGLKQKSDNNNRMIQLTDGFYVLIRYIRDQ